jgi:hypothetical protein
MMSFAIADFRMPIPTRSYDICTSGVSRRQHSAIATRESEICPWSRKLSQRCFESHSAIAALNCGLTTQFK